MGRKSSSIVSAMGLQEANMVHANIYPQPANQLLTVETAEPATAIIYGLNGAALINAQLQSGANTLNISSLPAGLYVIQISANNKVSTAKIVVQ